MEGNSQNPLQTQAVMLPANRAFVVQFESAHAGQATPIAGRVEHISSGRRERFHSWEELQQFIEQQLAQLEQEPPPSEDSEEI